MIERWFDRAPGGRNGGRVAGIWLGGRFIRLAVGIFRVAALRAQDLPPRQVLDPVAVPDNDAQSYTLYLPST